jgi:hypothetical protein
MDEESPKAIDASKFFGAGQAVVEGAATPAASVQRTRAVYSGGDDLSRLLRIIKTEIDLNDEEDQLKEDPEKIRLQSLVDGLTGRVDLLTSQLSGLFSLILGDIKGRDVEARQAVKEEQQRSSEISKATKLQALQATTQDIIQAADERSQQRRSEMEQQREMGTLISALGLGVGMSAMLQGKEEDLNQYIGGEPISNPVRAQEIYHYLISQGVSHTHAVGILNNIEHESGFDSGAMGDYENGKPNSFGLFQFNLGGGRAQTMFKAVGTDWAKDWKGQVNYALSEPAMKTYLKKSFASPADASKDFTINFENPANKEEKSLERLNTINTFDKFKDLGNQSSKVKGKGATGDPPQVAQISSAGPMISAQQEKLNANVLAQNPMTNPVAPQVTVLNAPPQTPKVAEGTSGSQTTAHASAPILPATNPRDPYPVATAINLNAVKMT